jgi:hypothetical protein
MAHFFAFADAVMSVRTEDRKAVFAVAHAYEMLDALKKDYNAMWRGGKRRAPIDEKAQPAAAGLTR